MGRIRLCLCRSLTLYRNSRTTYGIPIAHGARPAASGGGGFQAGFRYRSTHQAHQHNTTKGHVNSVDVTDRILTVKLRDEEWQYPLVWLRDSCTCSSCHEPSSGGRLLKLYEFSPDINIKDVKVRQNNSLIISFNQLSSSL